MFFKRFEDGLHAQYAYDLVYEGGVTEKYLKTVLEMPFNDFLTISAADVYVYYAQKYIPDAEQIKPKATTDDLAELMLKWI